jgi:solute carrier family 25 (mitochondrial uncoupling protein), member 8/9
MQAYEKINPPNLRWHVNDIHSHWGYHGFFKGVQPAIVRAIVLNAVFLSSYDHIKHFILKRKLLSDGGWTHFMASMGSGLAIALCTSSIDVVKSRIQNQLTTTSLMYIGIMDCSWKLLRTEGILAFYKGFTP